MSDVMLHGVLNMPIEIWGDDTLSKIQRHSRYVEASERIENLNRAILALTNSNSSWAMALSNDDEDLVRELLKIAN